MGCATHVRQLALALTGGFGLAHHRYTDTCRSERSSRKGQARHSVVLPMFANWRWFLPVAPGYRVRNFALHWRELAGSDFLDLFVAFYRGQG